MLRPLACLVVLLTFGLSGCASLFVDGKAPKNLDNLPFAITLRYEKLYHDRDPFLFYRFHENLSRFYGDFARNEHLSFLPSTAIIRDGTTITNTEESGGQFLRHHYTVHVDKAAGTVEWISPDSEVMVKKWNLVIHVATILRFHVERDKISEQLVIAFGSQRDLDAALAEGTEKIWTKHNKREMDNAFMIADYLVASGQMTKNPDTWTIAAIQDQLE